MSKAHELDWSLINKIVDGTATQRESAKWETLVQQRTEYTALIPWIRRLQAEQLNASSPFYAMDAWQDFKTKLPTQSTARQQPARIFSLWKISGVAAAIALIISLSWWIYPSLQHSSAKKANAMLSYTVPYGQQKRITLPDSTLIWINAGSSVKMPAEWNKDSTREVWLEGEGFFDVRTNSSLPFIVHTPTTTVRVLGTSFNIEAYHQLPVAVTVATGKVRLSSKEGQSVTIAQNQRSVWMEQEGVFQTIQTDALSYSAWREGILQFKDEPLSKVIGTLERKFNIPIVVVGTIGEDLYCTARFSAGESLDNILESLEHIYGLTVTKKEGTITIHLK